MNTEDLERESLDIVPGAKLEAILAFRERAHSAKKFAGEMADKADDALLAHIIATGKPVSIGDMLYVDAAYRKDVKCKNPTATLDALLTATGGDLGEVSKCLASNAWKHGACRLPLGDQYDTHFETTAVAYLKDGKPANKLASINKQFIK